MYYPVNWLFLPVALATVGCASMSAPLDLTSPSFSDEQHAIAGYYSQEALFFRLKAQEQAQRVLVYEKLFGPESEWVAGARLLKRFYEDSADEQERLATMHLRLDSETRHTPHVKPASP